MTTKLYDGEVSQDDLIAQVRALTEANSVLTDHIANLHNSVRHKFMMAVEAAVDNAFREMSAIKALREAHELRTTLSTATREQP